MTELTKSGDVVPMSTIFGDLAQQQTEGALATADMNATSGKFLRNLYISTYLSDPVVNGQVEAGQWYLKTNGEFQSLGDSLDMIAFLQGPKAIDFSQSPPITNYDRSSEIYQSIERRSGEKNSRCQAGRRLLVYVREMNECFEWFCGNTSQRRESAVIRDRYMIITQAMIDNNATAAKEVREAPIPFTVKIVAKKNKDGKFHIPKAEKCLTEFGKLDPVMIQKAITIFNNAGKEQGEVVDDKVVEGRRDR